MDILIKKVLQNIIDDDEDGWTKEYLDMVVKNYFDSHYICYHYVDKCDNKDNRVELSKSTITNTINYIDAFFKGTVGTIMNEYMLNGQKAQILTIIGDKYPSMYIIQFDEEENYSDVYTCVIIPDLINKFLSIAVYSRGHDHKFIYDAKEKKLECYYNSNGDSKVSITIRDVYNNCNNYDMVKQYVLDIYMADLYDE